MNILSLPFRLLLLLGSCVVFFVISGNIRQGRIQLKDGIFWIILSFLLILVSIFPILAVWASKLLGIQSPSNCVFFTLIFLMGCHQFSLTIRVSQLEMRYARLIQKIAIEKTLTTEEKSDETENLLLFR